MLYHWEIFTGIWHCLFIDQKNQKTIRASFYSIEFINLWKGTLHGADKCYLYLFVKLSKYCILPNS